MKSLSILLLILLSIAGSLAVNKCFTTNGFAATYITTSYNSFGAPGATPTTTGFTESGNISMDFEERALYIEYTTYTYQSITGASLFLFEKNNTAYTMIQDMSGGYTCTVAPLTTPIPNGWFNITQKLGFFCYWCIPC